MNKYQLFGLITLLLLSGCLPSESNENATIASNEIGFLFPPSKSRQNDHIASLQSYFSKLESTLQSALPVIPIDGAQLDEKEKLAQSIALHNAGFLRDINKRKTLEPLHTEIMSVRPATAEELVANKISATINIFRVEMYNFFYNTSTIAFVDIGKRQMVKVNYSTSTPNVINKNLQILAKEIALSSDEVLEALGVSKKQAGSLPFTINATKCERSRHLCTAPTFKKGRKELWVIVDLTDMEVVGYDWVTANPNRPTVVTERSIQNEYMMETYCDKDIKFQKNDWDITYTLTGSDGLEVKNVQFNGQDVLTSAKLVDWHVTYEYKEGFGYSDAIGCPMFSASAVVAFNGPEIEDIVVNGASIGFSIIQDFRSPVWPLSCNYRYQNKFEFYNDGRFRVTGVNLGLGCGKGGWYRPVFRMVLASEEGHGQPISVWENEGWKPVEKETWLLQDANTKYSPEGFLFQIQTGRNKGYFLEPGQGQFGDGGRGDNAYIYITANHKDGKEGQNNMPTIGSCCNTDFHQGPEAFLTPAESLDGEELTIWYVPQMPNDNTPGNEYCWVLQSVKRGQPEYQIFRGIVGPMFVPVKH